jgi:hypothetical protein
MEFASANPSVVRSVKQRDLLNAGASDDVIELSQI